MFGYQYDTQSARRFVSKVTEFIAYNAYSASVEFAKENGAFPEFCKEAFTQSGFLEKHRPSSELDWNLLIEEIQTYGLHQKIKADGCAVFENPPFVTALEMSVDDHIKMLAATAYNVDMSVLKTINIPTD